MSWMLVKVLIFLVVLIPPGAAFAEQSTRTLARFVDGEFFLENLVRFPTVEGDITETAYCFALVSSGGAIYNEECFVTGAMKRPFEKAISSAMRSAKAIPTTMDGKPRTVELPYQVEFIRKNDVEIIRVFPNWGYDSDKYGLTYHAPQRILVVGPYPEGCRPLNRNFSAIATNTISETGELVGEVSIRPSRNTMADRHCLSAIRNKHLRSQYIPGRYNGRSIEATYAEFWGNPDSFEVK